MDNAHIEKIELDILKKLNSQYADSDPRLLQIYSYFNTRSKSEIAKKLASKKYFKNMSKAIIDEIIDDTQLT